MTKARKRGTNFEDVHVMNMSVLVKLINRNIGCSRAELSKATGLKQASITKIIARLIELGIVKEVGIVQGKKGRRSIGLALNSNMYRVLGVKLTRQSFSVGLYDISGNEYKVHSETLDMLKGSVIAIVRMKEVVREFIEENDNIVAIGIAIPGPFLKSKEKIALITEFPGWEDVALKSEFFDEFGIPVYIEHDANAGALAEWWFGDRKMDSGIMVYFLASEGVGAGIIENGQLFTGSQGIAGEIGHMSIDYNGKKCSCGSYGCLETYCSTLSLVKETRKNLVNYPDSILNKYKDLGAGDIFDAMEGKDELAVKMVEQIGEYIGYGLVNIVNVYNPNIIVISDIYARGGDTLLSKIRETIKPRLLPSLYNNLNIEISKFFDDPILYGAAALATDEFLKDPAAFV